MKKLLFVLFLGLIACISEYKKGEEYFKEGNYKEAKLYYELVKSGDKDYKLAQFRIAEIDKIEAKQIYDKAILDFSNNDFDEAKALFNRIAKTDELYEQSQYFLSRIDSIEEVNKIEEVNLEKVKRIEEEMALKKINDEVRVLFNSLMAFKDESNFHKYGFGEGYKYNKWLKEVQDLKSSPDAKLLLKQGFVIGDLEMLGLEYVDSKGQETEYSLWAKKTIKDGLNK